MGFLSSRKERDFRKWDATASTMTDPMLDLQEKIIDKKVKDQTYKLATVAAA